MSIEAGESKMYRVNQEESRVRGGERCFIPVSPGYLTRNCFLSFVTIWKYKYCIEEKEYRTQMRGKEKSKGGRGDYLLYCAPGNHDVHLSSYPLVLGATHQWNPSIRYIILYAAEIKYCHAPIL